MKKVIVWCMAIYIILGSILTASLLVSTGVSGNSEDTAIRVTFSAAYAFSALFVPTVFVTCLICLIVALMRTAVTEKK